MKDKDNSKPKVSVIIPVYRGAEWLCEAVDSVLAQSLDDIEIIVVNDGSDEDLSRFLDKYQNKIHYIKTENHGVAAARNRGIREAVGEYIAFLDSDDLWLPEKLAYQTAKMSERGALWSYTDYETFGDDVPTQVKEMFPGLVEGLYNRFSPYIGTPTVMIARSLLTDNGFAFQENFHYGEDTVLWEQLVHTAPVLYIPRVLSRVRIRGANAGRRAAVQLRARVETYDKCCELIPGYGKERSLLYRTAVAMCRFGCLFVRKDNMDTRSAEIVARMMFAVPYMLFRLDRKLSSSPSSPTL